MRKTVVLWALLAIIIGGGLRPAQAASFWPTASSSMRSSPLYPAWTLATLLRHTILRPVLWLHFAPEPARAITIAPAIKLEAEQLQHVAEVLRHRLEKLELSNSSLEIEGEHLVLWIPGTLAGTSEALERVVVADVDLRFQVVEEEGAIPERVVTWLPEFVTDHPECATKLRVEKEYRGEMVGSTDRQILEKYVSWITPRISMIPTFAIGKQSAEGGESTRYLLYVLEDMAWLTARDVVAAHVDSNDWGDPYVLVEFSEEGGRRFGFYTESNVDRKLAIVLDGDVVSAPVIKEKISGGRAQITLGSGNQQEKFAEARALAARLSSGYLGVGLTVSTEEFVGRSPAQRTLLRAWWTLPGLPGLPAAQWLLHLGLSANRS
jgi:preprotein translocase subunit SecD